MSNLEQLISRYLDGELNALEQIELRRLLADSPEARALFREMTSVAHAARRMPLLHRPGGALEASLFQRLQQEGLYRDRGALENAGKRSWWRSIAPATRQRGALIGAALVVAFIGLFVRFAGEAPSRAPVAALRTANVPALSPDRGDRAALPPISLAPRHAERIDAAPLRGSSRPVVQRGSHASLRNRDVREPNRAPDLGTVDRSGQDSAGDSRVLDPANIASRTVDTLGEPSAPERLALADAEAPRQERAPSIFPQSDRGRSGGTDWIASLRGGLAAVNGIEGTVVREFDVKVGIEMKGGHQLSFIGGLASSISESRSENTGIALSAPAMSIPADEGRGVNARTDKMEESAFERNVQSEPWFGVGYNYSLPVIGDLSVEPGVKVGASASTWRGGIEIPVRYKVSEKVSLECAMSGVRILPRREQADRFQETDSPNHFIYEGAKTYRAFTTYGVQVGVRLDFGR